MHVTPSSPDEVARTAVAPTAHLETPAPSCLNCGSLLSGEYCSACGQRAQTSRITFPGLLRNAVDQVLSIDSRLARTFRALVRRPGSFIRSFLLGKRVGFARPMPYYLLVVALNVGAAALLRHPEGDSHANDASSFWDANFVALQIGLAFGLLMLPLAAARRVLYPEAGYSVAEHFVFLLYVLAQSILVLLATQLVLWPFGVRIDSNAEGLIWLTAFAGYVVWSSRGFVTEPWWKSALKLLAAVGILLGGLFVVGVVWQLMI